MTSVWTRQELLEEIELYKKAIKACASGSSYTIGSRSLTCQNLQELRDHLNYLTGELSALENGRGPVIVQVRIYRGPAGWRMP